MWSCGHIGRRIKRTSTSIAISCLGASVLPILKWILLFRNDTKSCVERNCTHTEERRAELWSLCEWHSLFIFFGKHNLVLRSITTAHSLHCSKWAEIQWEYYRVLRTTHPPTILVLLLLLLRVLLKINCIEWQQATRSVRNQQDQNWDLPECSSERGPD